MRKIKKNKQDNVGNKHIIKYFVLLSVIMNK